MELKEFIQNFADQFDETDASEITATTAFHDLDEEEYDVALKGDDMKSANTVEDLFNIVKSKL